MALAYVNRGRWVVLCPFLCASADLAERHGETFLCHDCRNNGTGNPVPLVWPTDEDRKAIEALLAVRPVIAQNWNVNENLGLLAAENVEHGLFDGQTGEVFGAAGIDQRRVPVLAALEAAGLGGGEQPSLG